GRYLRGLHAANILGEQRRDFDTLAFGLALDALALGSVIGLHLLTQRGPGLVVDRRNDVGREVQHALHVPRRNVEQQTQAAACALDEPDVADRRRQRDVAHAVAPDLRAGHLDATLI